MSLSRMEKVFVRRSDGFNTPQYPNNQQQQEPIAGVNHVEAVENQVHNIIPQAMGEELAHENAEEEEEEEEQMPNLHPIIQANVQLPNVLPNLQHFGPFNQDMLNTPDYPINPAGQFLNHPNQHIQQQFHGNGQNNPDHVNDALFKEQHEGWEYATPQIDAATSHHQSPNKKV